MFFAAASIPYARPASLSPSPDLCLVNISWAHALCSISNVIVSVQTFGNLFYTFHPQIRFLLYHQMFLKNAAAAKSFQSCLTLCDPMDCSPPGSSVHGILQARILEWVAMPSSKRSSWPGIKPTSLMSPALAGGFFTTSATWEALLKNRSCQLTTA